MWTVARAASHLAGQDAVPSLGRANFQGQDLAVPTALAVAELILSGNRGRC